MKPIQAYSYISKGIGVFFPDIDSIKNYLLKVEIFYSKINPCFSWIDNKTSEVKIWEETIRNNTNGILFLYQTPMELVAGFYTVKAAILSDKQPKTGQITIGLYKTTPYLLIGVPYSMYPPITLI